MTASDVLVETLLDWGVEVVFGLPGDGINGFMEALRTHKDRIRYVHVRHEEAAAMAETLFPASSYGLLGRAKEKLGGGEKKKDGEKQ